MRAIIIALMLWSSVVTLNAAEKTVVGSVKSVDTDKDSITVDNVVLDVTRKSQITVDGKKAGIADIKTGQPARVTYDDALEVVITIVVGDKADDDEATMKDMKALQGEWRCVAGEENGKPQEQSKVRQEGRRLIIRRHSLTMDKVGSSWIGKFEIDATNGHFDWIGKSLPTNTLTEWTGIYQLEGDELKLCFIFDKENKAKRPTEFRSLPPAQPGLAHALYTFKRVAE